MNYIIALFFILIIIKQLKYIKELLVPISKGITDVIIVSAGVCVLLGIMYFYADKPMHYLDGILAILTLLALYGKQGINLKGFVSMYKCKELIKWNEIEKITLINSENIKIIVSGGFMQQTFYFKKSDYDKIIDILKENLPNQVHINEKFD